MPGILTFLILAVAVLVAVVVACVNEIRMRNRAIQSITAEVRNYQRTLAQTREELAAATAPRRELLVRDGDKAIDHLSEITWAQPWASDGNGGQACFFCGVGHSHPARHLSNCRYLVATRFLERHEETLRVIQRR
ncbi:MULTISPECIES: hypothetical protein [Ramlibacter]|uniref:Uncharacterized protein n=1 Tax=Ramlibacter aquaticus TaxID=2780094 RepID=A0ABR9SFG7_9BURK|nr:MULTISPECIES: hypothetical protein [Ramlibacter]MBE7941096.1 hypothetical protein [Ramlibacter aquaticus]